MIYILLSVCCSVIVAVMLKLARRYNIDVFQAITWNYSTAILLTILIYRPKIEHLSQAPIYTYSLLGILLPAIFFVVAAAVRRTGIVRTDIAQRLSLFIPLTASFLLFREQPSPLKITGLVVGLAAVACSIPWQNKGSRSSSAGKSWIYLVVVFFGMGIIDILFKKVALFKEVPYTTSLLMIYLQAFALSLVCLLFLVLSKQIKFQLRHIFFGWILGIANFGNILFFLKAHQKLVNDPSAVFSAMNIGVITLGTLVGLIVFKEKLSWLNRLGIGLALVAIILITISQRG